MLQILQKFLAIKIVFKGKEVVSYIIYNLLLTSPRYAFSIWRNRSSACFYIYFSICYPIQIDRLVSLCPNGPLAISHPLI